MAGLSIHDPRRRLTVKQEIVLQYLIDNIESGPLQSNDIAEAIGYATVGMTLWSLSFQGIVDLERRGGRIMVTRVTAP